MITVVIVNYNAGALLTKCVKSVVDSTVPCRIVVSDNGSTDDSIALLRHHFGGLDSLTIIENQANLGFARANNLALQQAKSQYVLLLNPDCVIQPGTLDSMVQFMSSHPDAGMAGCLIRNMDGSEQAGCRRRVPTPWRTVNRVLKLHRLVKNHPRFECFNLHETPLPDAPIALEAISGAFMFIRADALEKVGLLDDKYFLHCEDLDWCMRFRQAQYNIYFVPDVEISHLKGASSMARPYFVEWHKHKGMVRFYWKFFRRQYPGMLMATVFLMVWVRFLAKAGYISAARFATKVHRFAEAGALKEA